MKKFDANAVQRLKARLQELPERQTLSPYDLIVQVADQLSSAQGRGYDLDDLMTVLRESGVTLSRNTVRNYLSRARGCLPSVRGAPPPAPVTRPEVAQMTRPTATSSTPRSAPPPLIHVDVSDSQTPQPSASNDGCTSNNNTPRAVRPGHFTMTPDRERL